MGGGAPYFVVERFLTLALDNYPIIDGWAAAHGMDPADLSLSRFCNFIYWWATRNADAESINKFDQQLWRPPPGDTSPIPDESPWSAKSELAASHAARAALGL